MGSSSKVVLIGAITLILGNYAISLKKVQTNLVAAASAQVNRVQTENTLDAAMRSALDEFVAGNGNSNKSGTLTAVDGGTFTYTVNKDGRDKAALQVTLTRNEGKRVATASLKKVGDRDIMKQGSRKIHRGKWQVDGSFVSAQ